MRLVNKTFVQTMLYRPTLELPFEPGVPSSDRGNIRPKDRRRQHGLPQRVFRRPG